MGDVIRREFQFALLPYVFGYRFPQLGDPGRGAIARLPFFMASMAASITLEGVMIFMSPR